MSASSCRVGSTFGRGPRRRGAVPGRRRGRRSALSPAGRAGGGYVCALGERSRPRRPARGARDRVRQIGEESRHLGARLEVGLGVGGESAASAADARLWQRRTVERFARAWSRHRGRDHGMLERRPARQACERRGRRREMRDQLDLDPVGSERLGHAASERAAARPLLGELAHAALRGPPPGRRALPALALGGSPANEAQIPLLGRQPPAVTGGQPVIAGRSCTIRPASSSSSSSLSP